MMEPIERIKHDITFRGSSLGGSTSWMSRQLSLYMHWSSVSPSVRPVCCIL